MHYRWRDNPAHSKIIVQHRLYTVQRSLKRKAQHNNNRIDEMSRENQVLSLGVRYEGGETLVSIRYTTCYRDSSLPILHAFGVTDFKKYRTM